MTRRKTSFFIHGVLAVIFLILVLFIVVINNESSNIIQYQELNATVKIGEYVGINLDTDKLHFGTVTKGGYGERGITINSDEDGYIYVTSQGDIGNWLYISNRSNLTVTENSSTIIHFFLVPEDNAKEGMHEDVVRFYILKEKPDSFADVLLKGKPLKFADPDKIITPAVYINITRPENQTNKTN